MKLFKLFFIFLLINTHVHAATKVSATMDEVMAFMAAQPSPNVKNNGIGILVYDGVNGLDAIGPYKVFMTAGLNPFLIAPKKGTITTNDKLVINVDKSIDDVNTLDILLVPGGAYETAALTKDTKILDWIKKIDKNTIYTTSVCTGSWVLGEADLLVGKKATSNWYRAEEMMIKYGAKFQKKRWVKDGKYWTSAGVTAGTDMALAIVLDLYGKDYTQAVMQDLEYSPSPPVTLSSIKSKTKAIMEYMYDYYLLSFVKTGELPAQ